MALLGVNGKDDWEMNCKSRGSFLWPFCLPLCSARRQVELTPPTNIKELRAELRKRIEGLPD